MRQLSIVVPGFRTQSWHKLYMSACASTELDFEMVFVGPYAPPDSMKDFKNIRYLQDFGCPTRCMQLACLIADSEIVQWGSDDCMFLPNNIDATYKIFQSIPGDKKAVASKYYEGNNSEKDDIIHMDDQYYKINHHDGAKSIYIPDHYMLFAPGMIYKQYLMKLGGFDCNFNGLALAVLDLAIRIQRDGATFVLTPFAIERCSFCIKDTGDHGPIERSQTEIDQPYYDKIHRSPTTLERTKINLFNWQETDSIWKYRKF